MPDRELNMRRTESGLLVPDHVISNEPGKQEEEKPAERKLIKLNRATRRKLLKPWRIKKTAPVLLTARRPTRKARKVRGCAEDCDCHLRRVSGPDAGGTGD